MSDTDGPEFGELADGEVPGEDELVAGVESLSLTPEEHQRVKDIVHGDEFGRLAEYERRYLVCGAGDDSGAASRRTLVYDRLDGRTNPPAVATRLEEFGLTKAEIHLWVHLFDKLCAFCTHVTAVIEDFDGGYLWELGLLFAPEYREKVWVLKRRYTDADEERKRYDNGMGASHVRLLLTGDRACEWTDTDGLRECVKRVP